MKRRKVAIKEAKLEAIEEFCPHCRRETSHILQWKYQRWAKDREGKKDEFSYRSYYVAVCDDCKEVLLYVNDPPHEDCSDRFDSGEADTVLLAGFRRFKRRCA